MSVVSTAGHVDHGKSTLVRVLTGTDPDRFAEEKEREDFAAREFGRSEPEVDGQASLLSLIHI